MSTKFSRKEFFKPENRYVRVGVDYFKVIEKIDRYGIKRTELKKWNKDEIRLDHGKDILKTIPKYDDFTIVPDNMTNDLCQSDFYNLYAPFNHKPEEGEWKWTKVLLSHIFGEQYDIGITYMQVLYMFPKQALPVLVLVSKERSTGKSTFVDWLMMLFGANMSLIFPTDLSRTFNGSYSRSNIIAIEETVVDQSHVVEKIKALSTQKTINANLKNVNDFQIPFFGKIILASNNERKFMKVDIEEIRFFIRKINTPTITNHNILNDMVSEIPAFLYYLESLPVPDFSKSRMVFTPSEISNDSLKSVKNESHTWLYKELFAIFEDQFNNYFIGETMKSTPKEIKDTFFTHNSNVTGSFIKDVLLDEFKFTKAQKNESYKSLNNEMYKTGQPFYIPKSEIIVIKSGEEKDEKNDKNSGKEAKNSEKTHFLKNDEKIVIKYQSDENQSYSELFKNPPPF
jgi:hypothetical protein